MVELTIDQALQKAIEAHKAGNLQEADRYYTAILNVQPEHPDANHNIGILAVHVGKVQESLSFFKTALEADQNKVQFWVSYIKTQIALGLVLEAEATLDEATKNGICGKDLNELFTSLKQAQHEFTNTSKVKRPTSTVKSNILDNFSLGQALNLAKKKKKEGTIDEATQIYRDILLKFPKNETAIKGLKRLTYRAVQNKNATQDPDQEQLQELISLHGQGNLQLTIEKCNQLIKIYRGSALVYNIKGAAHKGLGQLALSIDAYNKALIINPELSEVHYNLGNALKDIGELENAIGAYKRALSINPKLASAHYNIGNVYKTQRNLQKASEAYKRAIKLDPKSAGTYNNLGTVLLEKGDLSDSLDCYYKALEIDANFVDTLLNLTNLHIQFQNNPLFNERVRQKISYADAVLLDNPKYLIQKALKFFLLGSEDTLGECLEKYYKAPQIVIDTLSQNDKVFCTAYAEFLTKLIEEKSLNKMGQLGNANIFHFGESHCLSYSSKILTLKGKAHQIKPMITIGAKAFHFASENNNAFKAVTKANFHSCPDRSVLFISFGEIDCRPNEGILTAIEKSKKPKGDIISDTVNGFVDWFSKENQTKCHDLYFFNVPAPVYNLQVQDMINCKCADIVVDFNNYLEERLSKTQFKLIDVHSLTVGTNGFSNGRYHLDSYHLNPSTIDEIFS